MRRLTGWRRRSARRTLCAASLLEAIVAAVLFLIVFASAMELIPRLTVRDDEALLLAEADYRVKRAMERYATGVWPCGTYGESYDWGRVEVRVTRYRDFADMQQVMVTACIDGSRRRFHLQRVVEWLE